MLEKELIEVFLDFERENELFEFNISGVPLWNIMRFDLYSEIQKELFSIGVAHTSIMIPRNETRKQK